MMNQKRISPILQALTAALLFGASAPLAKLLLGAIEPIPLAAFLYLGSGIGLSGVKLFQRVTNKGMEREAGIKKPDTIWLAGAVLAGGVAAPIILLFSLRNTPAATASLLLCFEGVATTLIAFIFFKESISRRAWLAVTLITLASIFLSINLNAAWGFSMGALGILAACILWGIDNNFTRNISAKDPLMIVIIKGLGAGIFSLGLAIVLGNKLPPWQVVFRALILGCFSYGISTVLFIRAMRGLGAARTSALYSIAPFAGMLLSFALFRENPGWLFMVAFPLMAAGMLFLVNEKHEHYHVHGVEIHEHAHIHTDGHHEHAQGDTETQEHSHIHKHEELPHSHTHLPDVNHRHGHPSEPKDN
jgi:drug/metabolite transporter (DMT)-like permease